MTGDGTNDRGAQPPRTLFSLGREGSKRRRGGTDVAEVEAEAERPAPIGEPCADCGAELIVGAAFCGECGTSVASAELIDENLELDDDGASAELIDEDLGLDDDIDGTDLLDEDFEIDEEILALGVIDGAVDDDVTDELVEGPVVDEGPVLDEGSVLDDDLVDDDDLEAHGEEALIEDVGVDDDLLDEELVADDDADDDKIGPALAVVGGAAVAGAAAKSKRRGKTDDDAEQTESGLTVLAAAHDQGPPPKPVKVVKAPKEPKDPRDGKRVPIGWIIGGIAAAILIVVGVVALAGGGDSAKKDDVASSQQSTTTTRQGTTTSTAVTTTTQATTTSTEAATTTSAAPVTQAPQTTITNTGPAPDAPKTPPALRVAALTCPLGSNPCTISKGGTLTVTLVNDGGQSGGYSLSGPGLQGPSGQLVGSVSVTVRDTVGQPDRLATLHIVGAGGLDEAYPVLMK